MTADALGLDLEKVNVPITGMAAIAPVDIANVPTPAALAAWPLTLPAEVWKKLGLYKQDGGVADSRESDDPIEFFQKGPTLAGEGTRGFVIGLAEDNPAVLLVTEGREPDENGIIKASSSLPDNEYIVLTVTQYRNGLRKGKIGVASVTAVEPDQQERGTVEGVSVTFTWREHEIFEGSPFWEFRVGDPAAVVTSVTAGAPGSFAPASATLPANITALRAIGALGQTDAWTTGQYVVLGNSAQVSWDGTDWKTGIAS